MDLDNWPDEGGSVVLCPSAADAAVRRELAIRLLQTGELINAEILQMLQTTHVLLLKASLQTYTKVDHVGGYSQTPIPRYQPAKNGGHGIWPASLHLPKEILEAGGECSMEAQRNLDRIRSILQNFEATPSFVEPTNHVAYDPELVEIVHERRRDWLREKPGQLWSMKRIGHQDFDTLTQLEYVEYTLTPSDSQRMNQLGRLLKRIPEATSESIDGWKSHMFNEALMDRIFNDVQQLPQVQSLLPTPLNLLSADRVLATTNRVKDVGLTAYTPLENWQGNLYARLQKSSEFWFMNESMTTTMTTPMDDHDSVEVDVMAEQQYQLALRQLATRGIFEEAFLTMTNSIEVVQRLLKSGGVPTGAWAPVIQMYPKRRRQIQTALQQGLLPQYYTEVPMDVNGASPLTTHAPQTPRSMGTPEATTASSSTPLEQTPVRRPLDAEFYINLVELLDLTICIFGFVHGNATIRADSRELYLKSTL